MQPIQTRDDMLAFYTHQTPYSDPGAHAALYDGLPDDIPSLCRAVQNALLHIFWISKEAVGTSLAELKHDGRKPCFEFSIGTVAERLAWIENRNPSPLSDTRTPTDKSIGCCRDFALLLTSILRHRGIPARVRFGAAHYLIPDSGRIEDHCITQFWNAEDRQWQFVDPQIDPYQRKAMKIDFDPADVPQATFLTGEQLLGALRVGSVDPTQVGFPPVNTGLTYGRNKLFQDLLSLVGQEMRVYAWWGIGDPKRSESTGDEAFLDRLLILAQGIEADRPEALQEALSLAKADARLIRPEGYDPGTWHAPGFC